MSRLSLSSLVSSCSKSTKSIQICANEQVCVCKDVNFENAAPKERRKKGNFDVGVTRGMTSPFLFHVSFVGLILFV